MKFGKLVVSPSFCIILERENFVHHFWWTKFWAWVVGEFQNVHYCAGEGLSTVDFTHADLWILCYESLNIHLFLNYLSEERLQNTIKLKENPGHFNHSTFTIGLHFFRAGAILPNIRLQLPVSSTKVRDKCLLMNVWMGFEANRKIFLQRDE